MSLVTRCAVVALLGLASLAACSADDAQRSVYNSLKRYEETRPAPGEDRRSLPTYDDYTRQRRAPAPG
jgi:hypothetical protein